MNDDDDVPYLMDVNDAATPSEWRLATLPAIIGRGSTCDVIVRSLRVSRRHASIERTNKGYLLRNLKDSNLTFVGGKLITECLLTEGSEIGLASPEPMFVFFSSGKTYLGIKSPALPEAAVIVDDHRLVYDVNTTKFKCGQFVFELPRSERLLLRYFLDHEGRLCSQAEIANAVFERDFDKQEIYSLVYKINKRLREELPAVFARKPIRNIEKEGYIFEQ